VDSGGSDLLWSDPMEEKTFTNPREFENYRRTAFDSNPTRGCSYMYGYCFLKEFCADNKLLGIVRAHEVQKHGYLQHWFGREDRADPFVTTVFSAPNYTDTYGNWAAVMKYDGKAYTFEQFAEDEHPYYLPNFQNALNYTLPFVSENGTDDRAR
jgi:serine/threonine-protein phosphatase 2B catalytic subunit